MRGMAEIAANKDHPIELRAKMYAELAHYVYPKRKAIHMCHGGDGEPFEFTLNIGNSIEGVAALQYELFNFGDPETDIVVSFTILPSFSDWGRVRMDLNSRIRYELFKDFFWSVSLFDQFDSEPPSEGTERNDFGINTSVGWSF